VYVFVRACRLKLKDTWLVKQQAKGLMILPPTFRAARSNDAFYRCIFCEWDTCECMRIRGAGVDRRECSNRHVT
jgi:hypothetical protein